MEKEVILRLYLKPSTAQLFENRSQHCQPYLTPPHCGRRSHRRPRDWVPLSPRCPPPRLPPLMSPRSTHRPARKWLPAASLHLRGRLRPPTGLPVLAGHRAVISLIVTALTWCWACARPPLTTRQPALCLRVTNPVPAALPPSPSFPDLRILQSRSAANPPLSPLCPVCRSPR